MKVIFPEVISDTDISLWSMCEQRWARVRSQCLVDPTYNVDLSAGAAFAKGIELTRKSFYIDGSSEEDSIQEGKNLILSSMEEEEEEGSLFSSMTRKDELKSPEKMASALEGYFKHFNLSSQLAPIPFIDGDSKGIEHNFLVELPFLHPVTQKPLVYKSKVDYIAKNSLGRNTIIDEKTTKFISKNTGPMLEGDSQFIGYCWAADENGYDISTYIIRKIQLLKNETRFHEYEFPVQEFNVNSWEQDTFEKIERMVFAYNRERYLKDYKHGCTAFNKPCPFKVGCISDTGERELKVKYRQLVYNKNTKELVPIEEYEYQKGEIC